MQKKKQEECWSAGILGDQKGEKEGRKKNSKLLLF